jgi:hypothetical protein
MFPYNHKLGQVIQTDVDGVELDRGFMAHFQVLAADAVALDDDGVLAATALTDAAQEITEDITDPAVPRNISVKGNAADNAGDVVITGTNYADEEITETIALSGTAVVQGNKAFKTVTQVDLPAETHAGTDTVAIGWNNKLGLPVQLTHNTVMFACLDNTRQGTAPTVAVSATAIESNTIKLNTALSGKVVDAYLVI